MENAKTQTAIFDSIHFGSRFAFFDTRKVFTVHFLHCETNPNLCRERRHGTGKMERGQSAPGALSGLHPHRDRTSRVSSPSDDGTQNDTQGQEARVQGTHTSQSLMNLVKKRAAQLAATFPPTQKKTPEHVYIESSKRAEPRETS